MASAEGGISALERRILVPDELESRAKAALGDDLAGLQRAITLEVDDARVWLVREGGAIVNLASFSSIAPSPGSPLWR